MGGIRLVEAGLVRGQESREICVIRKWSRSVHGAELVQ
jgi:hypothetical protein